MRQPTIRMTRLNQDVRQSRRRRLSVEVGHSYRVISALIHVQQFEGSYCLSAAHYSGSFARDAATLVARVRDHYVEQFKAFGDKQKLNRSQGASEVKQQFGETSELFQRLNCVDFIKNDAQSET